MADAHCRNLTASWVRSNEGAEKCSYYENLEDTDTNTKIASGVYTLDDFKEYAKSEGYCPYFFARRALPFANVIIYSYHYLLDPKVAENVSKELSKDAIVVFDEAHNIDNVCTESLSIDISRPNLDASSRCVASLAAKIDEMKVANSEKLQHEYSRLVEGLRIANNVRQNEEILANPALPDDILQEAVPGNIRKAEHFVAFLRRFVEYLKVKKTISLSICQFNSRERTQYLDENESISRCSRNSHFFFVAFAGCNIYRAETLKVLCRAALLPNQNLGDQRLARLWPFTENCIFCHIGFHLSKRVCSHSGAV
jgi:DNA repair helicase Rad3